MVVCNITSEYLSKNALISSDEGVCLTKGVQPGTGAPLLSLDYSNDFFAFTGIQISQ